MFPRRAGIKLLISMSALCAFCVVSSSQEAGRHYNIGIALTGSKPTCPIFVMSVGKNSPAAQAGIKAGDRLTTVDGNTVKTLRDAAQRITSNSPGPVTLQMMRDDKSYSVTVQREEFATLLRKDGLRMLPDGSLVSGDAADVEIQHFLSIRASLENAKDLTTAFPSHYPANKQLYYPGFEVFTWDDGTQVTVGGIEDGPAARAGIRWGDRIIALNGVDPRKKSVAELESLLSSSKPSSMTLIIERGGPKKTFTIALAQAAVVLRDNQWQVINGKLVPLWAPEKYLSCFE
jgi:C-terminal processing protease CtpA/Prc